MKKGFDNPKIIETRLGMLWKWMPWAWKHLVGQSKNHWNWFGDVLHKNAMLILILVVSKTFKRCTMCTWTHLVAWGQKNKNILKQTRPHPTNTQVLSGAKKEKLLTVCAWACADERRAEFQDLCKSIFCSNPCGQIACSGLDVTGPAGLTLSLLPLGVSAGIAKRNHMGWIWATIEFWP